MTDWKDGSISSAEITVAELYEFTLTDATVLRFTTFEFDIEFEGNVYTAAPIDRTVTDKDSDLSMAEITVTVPRDDAYITTEQLFNRYLDGSVLKITWIDRADHTAKRIHIVGKAGEVSYNVSAVQIAYKNEFNDFKKTIPVRRYTEGCNHSMYDVQCTLLKANTEVTGSAQSGSGTSLIIDPTRTEGDGYFDLGYIEFTSGANNGSQRAVSIYEVGEINLMTPLLNTVGIGDTYKMYPHCKKTYESCKDDFSNEINYGGFQDIPRPEEAMI